MGELALMNMELLSCVAEPGQLLTSSEVEAAASMTKSLHKLGMGHKDAKEVCVVKKFIEEAIPR